jgi:hypothetical protein
MNKVKMKVVAYEEESKSLIIAFASDETLSNNPDDYAKIAYQPTQMWPGEINAEQLKKNIALTGLSHTAQQAMRERAPVPEELIVEMKSWVGQTFTFNSEDLTVPAPLQTPFHTI